MPPYSFKQRKMELRARYREIRREIPDAQRRRDNLSINTHLEAVSIERRAVRIAGYLSFDGEPDISVALSRLNRKRTEIYLPVISAGANNQGMSFRQWSPEGDSSTPEKLKRNDFGIREPMNGELCVVNDLDILFMPLVAWDQSGGRLGMGAGYYDRALKDLTNATQPLRIGVAWQAQRAVSLPMTETDVRLHGILTESGLFTFKG